MDSAAIGSYHLNTEIGVVVTPRGRPARHGPQELLSDETRDTCERLKAFPRVPGPRRPLRSGVNTVRFVTLSRTLDQPRVFDPGEDQENREVGIAGGNVATVFQLLLKVRPQTQWTTRGEAELQDPDPVERRRNAQRGELKSCQAPRPPLRT